MFSASFTQESKCTLTKLNKGSKVDAIINYMFKILKSVIDL